MRKNVWILLIAGVFACGVFVAACGGDDETSSSTEVTVEDTDVSTTTSGDETTVTSDDSGGVDTEAFLEQCNSAVEGTPAESVGQQTCQQAADALEQCAGQANDDTAIEACQQVADEAVKQLEAVN